MSATTHAIPMLPLRTFPVLMAFCVFTGYSRQHDIPVIPTPREVKLLGGEFRLSSQTRIVLGQGCGPEDRFTADQLNEHLIGLDAAPLERSEESRVRQRSSNVIYLAPPEAPRASSTLRDLGMVLTGEITHEGYVLTVTNDGVAIIASTARGRFYGMMTVLQLITKQKRSLTIPRVQIRDWPALAMRGISDDLSRGQVSTMDNFKAIIRFLARYKMNVYSPYIEDIFVFKNHPEIGKDRGALSPSDIRELDAYAKRYHVELIPTFETLGHWENILRLPAYASYAEFPGAHTLNVSDERVYALLDEMIGELAAAFSSPYFNMAADESWDVGLGASRKRVEQSDLATVHAEHYKRLFTILEKYEKRPLMYGDILLNHPSILEKIPRDVIIVDWQYWAGNTYPSPTTFRTAGFPFIVSPAIWNFTGPWPNFLNTVINVRNFTRDGFHNGALGVLTSNWNDYGGEALRELNYYGFAWTAECAWQPLEADVVHFEEKFYRQFFGTSEAGEAVRAAYGLMNNPYTHLEWHEIWRHPLLPIRSSVLNNLWRFEAIASTMPLVKDLLHNASAHGVLHKEQLECMTFVADLNLWFTEKVRAHNRIRSLQADSLLGPAEKGRSIRAVAEPVIEALEGLKHEFTRLWLRTNKVANLRLLTDRYDRQISYWKEIIDNPLMGDPSIPSSWLYHPKAHPSVRDSSAAQVPKAFFRIVFDGDSQSSPGGIQVIADTYAKVFVNGTELGSISARRSLSLTVELERVRRWDLTKVLRPGKNIIAVEAANFDQFGSAGINILGYRMEPGGSVKTIVLDSLVKVTEGPQSGWMGPNIDEAGWVLAAPKEFPYKVVAPDFARGRLSWIER